LTNQSYIKIDALIFDIAPQRNIFKVVYLVS